MLSEDQPRRFGPNGRFELQPLQRRLLVDGAPVGLGARAFDLLLALASRPGALQTKNELLQAVWPDVVVEEGNLATQISALRKVLGGDVIATIPGQGYRFTMPVEAPEAPPSLAAPAPTSSADLGSAGLPMAPQLRTNLPAEVPALLGRADDLAALRELVAQHRLVTIVGAGGIGKTRLAQTLLHHAQKGYPHGVCWVDLSLVTDAALLPGSLGAALGVRVDAADPMKGLCESVAPLDMLVALDNAEHLLDRVAWMAKALLDAAPGLRLVVTSQAPLKLAPEYVYRVDTLSVPQGPLPAEQALAFGAVALFAERARQAGARFELDDANAPAVIGLCRQLDGIPLAIELAAARVPMLGVHQLVASMHERLSLLTDSRNRAAPARQRTLRAALDWSHGLLEPVERTVFRRMAVFAGSGSLQVVERVVCDDALDKWAMLDALAALVDRSLVVAVVPDDGTVPRYRLLETPRAFALERLCEAGEEGQLRRRHASAFASLFDAAYDEPYSGAMGWDAWKHRMAPELDNAREAIDWASKNDEAEIALQLAPTLRRALPAALHQESEALARQVEPMLGRVASVELQWRGLHMMAVTASETDPARARSLAQRAADLPLETLGQERARWFGYWNAGILSVTSGMLGELDAAQAALDVMRSLEDAAWPPHRRSIVAEADAMLQSRRGRHEQALALLRQQLSLERLAGRSATVTLSNIVEAELAAGDEAAAVRTGVSALAELEATRDEFSLCFLRVNLGAAYLALGDLVQAQQALGVGVKQAPRMGLSWAFSHYLPLLCALDSRPRAAARLAGYAHACRAPAGARGANEAAALERATRLARAALGDAEFDQLSGQGAMLNDAAAAAIAFTDRDAE